MRRISLNARRAADAASSGEVELVLIQVEHPGLATPIRLSTDATERISAEPLVYGTRSAWNGADPASEPYLYILASAEVPSDLRDTPPGAAIVLENVSTDIAETLRAFVHPPATVHLAVVLASAPDDPEVEFRDMRLTDADGDAAEVTLLLTRRAITEESTPTDRFTRDRFPGLHR